MIVPGHPQIWAQEYQLSLRASFSNPIGYNFNQLTLFEANLEQI